MCLPGKLSSGATMAPAQSPASMCAVGLTIDVITKPPFTGKPSSWLWEKDGVSGALQGAEHVKVAARRVFGVVALGSGVLDVLPKLPASVCAAALLCACVGATAIVDAC